MREKTVSQARRARHHARYDGFVEATWAVWALVGSMVLAVGLRSAVVAVLVGP